MEQGSFKWFLIVFSIIGVAFIVIPLLRLIVYPSLPLIGQTLKDTSSINAILNSVVFSLTSSLIAGIFGIPIAYLMAKGYFKKAEGFVEAVCDTPLATPHIVAGIALLLVFGRDGVIGRILYEQFNVKLLGTGFAVVIAMLFVSFPFFIDTVREGFRNIDPSFERASSILGARFIHTFFLVDIPLAKQHILSGFFSSWARAMSEFGAVIIVAYYPMTASIKIYDAYTQYNLETSIAIAATLLLISLLVFAILRVIGRRGNG